MTFYNLQIKHVADNDVTFLTFKLHNNSVLFTNNMKWSPIIVVIAFVCTNKSLAGNFKTKADCTGSAFEWEKTQLTCTIIGEILGGILWVRPDGKKAVKCNTQKKECTPGMPKFKGVYKAFFNSDFHITMVIESFEPRTDVGQWTCTDTYKTINSTCYKHSAGSGASVGVISTFVLIFWVTAILATGLQVTTNTFPI